MYTSIRIVLNRIATLVVLTLLLATPGSGAPGEPRVASTIEGTVRVAVAADGGGGVALSLGAGGPAAGRCENAPFRAEARDRVLAHQILGSLLGHRRLLRPKESINCRA